MFLLVYMCKDWLDNYFSSLFTYTLIVLHCIRLNNEIPKPTLTHLQKQHLTGWGKAMLKKSGTPPVRKDYILYIYTHFPKALDS